MASPDIKPNQEQTLDLTRPDFTGYLPEHALLPLTYITLPEDPTLLKAPDPSLIALREARKAGDPQVEVAILANEAVFTQALDQIAETLEPIIDSQEETFVAYIADGGERLQNLTHKRLPNLIPSAQGPTSPPKDHPLNSGYIKVERTNDDATLSDEGPKIISGFEHYDIQDKHVIICEDLLDSNQSLQAIIENAVKNGASKITIVALVNKLNLPDAPTQEGKTILSTPENIPLNIIVPIGIPGNYWIGGWGSDFKRNIGRWLDFLGVLIHSKEE
jgi:pyrimidine operon attenuation protein/uracil phosphoribosyltransferase